MGARHAHAPDVPHAPSPGTRRGVRSPPRQADPETGAATHHPLCDAKLKKQGALAEKTLGKARGVDTHPPRAPQASNQAITSMRDERPRQEPPASPRNRRVDAAAQATVRRRHDTLVAHNVRELADTLSHQLRVLHNVRRMRHHARDQVLALRQFDVAPDRPLVRVASIRRLERQAIRVNQQGQITMSLNAISVVCGPCHEPQHTWKRTRDGSMPSSAWFSASIRTRENAR